MPPQRRSRSSIFLRDLTPSLLSPVNYFGGTKGPIQVSRIQNQAPFIMSYDNNYCSGAGGTKWPMGSGGILWRRVAAPCPSEGEGVCARLGTGSAGWGMIVRLYWSRFIVWWDTFLVCERRETKLYLLIVFWKVIVKLILMWLTIVWKSIFYGWV